MPAFVTLAEVKSILWVTTSSEDTKLQAILDSVLDKVTKRIGDISSGDKTETIKKTSLLKDDFLPLSIINPTVLKTIDGVDFTWKVEGSDYLLLENGMVQVIDLLDYITTDFDYFKVTYTAWYLTAPKDFVMTIANIVWLEYSKDMWKAVTEETTWPRTVRYESSWTSWDTQLKELYASLRKYIPIHLRVY